MGKTKSVARVFDRLFVARLRVRDGGGAALRLPDDFVGRPLRERRRDPGGRAVDQQGESHQLWISSGKSSAVVFYGVSTFDAVAIVASMAWRWKHCPALRHRASPQRRRDYGDIDGFPPVFATGRDVLAFFSLSQRSFESNLYRLLAVGLCLRTAVFVAVALTAGRRGLLEVVTEAQATENPLVS